MGEARFTVEAVKKLVSFPIKSGRVWFSKIEQESSDVQDTTKCTAEANRKLLTRGYSAPRPHHYNLIFYEAYNVYWGVTVLKPSLFPYQHDDTSK